MDALSNVNEAQRAAITAPIGPVLVRAGAGSGKTRVLTLRIAYLIEQHRVKPDAILALTFTNKAAKEMRERLRQQIGRGVRGLVTGTFHAVCARLLREEIDGRIGSYTGAFSIYAADEQLQLATDALANTTERPPVLIEADEVLRRISRAKSRMLSPRLMARLSPDPVDRFVAGCYRRYQRALEQANALDFDDLILLTHRLWHEHHDVLEACQARWRHVLVDEYQDTDPSQHALVELLTRPGDANGQTRSLFVVGDGMQSIYGFRNADHSIITRFAHDFPEAQVIELQTNYRSRQPILDAAYAVIRHSRSVAPMNLQAARKVLPGDRCLLINEAKNGREEAEQIARTISELQQQGRPLREMAILYRTRHMSRPLETALRHARLSYAVRGSVGFYDRAVIRDALAFLRVINNPADNLSFNRIANVPPRGLGAQALARLTDVARHAGLSLVASLSHPEAQKSLSPKAAEGARRLASLFARWQRMAEGTTPPDHLLADVLEQSGYMTALEQRFSPEELPEARAHLQELMLAAEEHTDLRSLLQEIALLTSADTGDEARDQVQLLTIHAAKGLEWPFVFVTGLEEKTLPHERSMGSSEGIEEERRLCYVALTRAGERLYLSWAPGRNRGQQLKPSRFLDEIIAYGRERGHR
ncbi:UvrD-helicase domain-containing protein [Candidatus Chloroploca sp. M-50]|uniref:DNA 3'-5' helicase n=1 Tax=Candidatus Chloroploca mongolica TaxID=2528176 RepID=A0ABS4DCM2_9CHLR|nr:UvrD-helicase domain-containing protein [Candidatus Chloroploca mongolica]MBP1467184.1 UvrD-helicase domain-containing protein [Candidatus Chloroploca mongolica]